MKVVIAGTRTFDNYELLKQECDKILSETQEEIEIVSGGARGADALGERYAKENEYKLTIFPANWDRFGKRAGYLRNEEMADYADAVIAFWDERSRGTYNMIELAARKSLKLRVIRYKNIK